MGAIVARISVPDGDIERVGEGVMELRIEWGAGFASISRDSTNCSFSFFAAETRGRAKVIRRAKAQFEDFKARTAKK